MKKNMKYRHKILTIAGSDSSAGAGIQADLKTISSLGSYGLTVITMVTAQNTQGVQNIHPMSSDIVDQQIDSVFSDIRVDAVKLGALYDSTIIGAVVDKLKCYDAANIVLDPVMFSKNLSKLLKDDAVEAMKMHLIPICRMITPNISEAESLTDMKISNKQNMEEAGRRILELGCQSVLIKGGHLNLDDKAVDCLILKNEKAEIEIEYFESDRVDTKNTHGTGCSLSSAIATFLGQGCTIKEAVSKAKKYITLAIESAKTHKLGEGFGPVDHFFEGVEKFAQKKCNE